MIGRKPFLSIILMVTLMLLLLAAPAMAAGSSYRIASEQTGSTTVISATYGGASAVYRIAFNQSDYTVRIGESVAFTLKGDMNLSGDVESDLMSRAKFTSANPNAVKVDSGTIRGINGGTTTITAEYDGLTATASVTILGEDPSKTQSMVSPLPKDQGLAYINAVRRSAGLTSLTEAFPLWRAAQAHAAYLESNGAGNSTDYHGEVSGRADFTGGTPQDRARNLGYSSNDVQEVVAHIDNTDDQGVKSLIDSPYDRVILLEPTAVEIGVGVIVGAAGWTTANVGFNVTDQYMKDYVVEYPGSSSKVPPYWIANAAPNPMTPFGKAGAKVGYPITVSTSLTSGKLKFNDAAINETESGDLIDFYVTDASNGYNDHTVILTPVEPLKYNTSYTVYFAGETTNKESSLHAITKTWTFTTEEVPTSLEAVPIEPVVPLPIPPTTAVSSPSSPSVPDIGSTELFDKVMAGKASVSEVRKFTEKMPDVHDHWAEPVIAWGLENKMIEGYEDGSFRPDGQVTEAEFLALLIRAFRADTSDLSTDNSVHWADTVYRIAQKYEVPTVGTVTNLELRSTSLSRMRIAEIVAAVNGISKSGSEAIQYLLDAGYSQGKTAATIEGYHGEEPVTRAEAVALIMNMKANGFEQFKKK